MRTYAILAISCAGACVAACAAAQTYPVKPVRIIVPTSPPSATEITARLISEPLSQRLGQQVVVESRAGASTMIGGELVAKAPPDGYTLLMGISTLAINPATFRKVPYDALRDFAPISQSVNLPYLLTTHPSLPVKSVQELIALAKSRPGEIAYASAGHGTNPHLTMALFLSMTGTRMLHVPFKGGGASAIGLMSGEAPVGVTAILGGIGYARSGRLRALGVTSAARLESLPEIPTVAEAGVPGYESLQWYGLLAPAATPREIITRLHRETAAILHASEMQERFARDGAQAVGSSPEEFAAFIRAETAKWAKVARSAGIEPE